MATFESLLFEKHDFESQSVVHLLMLTIGFAN